MTKKIVVFTSIFLLLLINNFSVYAVENELTQDEIPTTYSYFGDATSYASGGISGSSLQQAVCGEDILCFNGYGIYIILMKYDYTSKNKTIIGTPVLIHNGSLLSETKVVDIPASEAKLNPEKLNIGTQQKIDNKNSCFYPDGKLVYEAEHITKYPKSKIKYCISGSDCRTPIIMVDKNLPSITSGNLGAYVKNTLIDRYAGDLNKIKGTFKLGNQETNDFVLNMEDYYLAFEPVIRQGTRTSDTELSVVSGDIKETKNPKKFNLGLASYNFKCSVNNKTTSVIKFMADLKNGLPFPDDKCETKSTSGYYKSSDGETHLNRNACQNYCLIENCTCEYVEKTTSKTGSWEYQNCLGAIVSYDVFITTVFHEGISTIRPARETNSSNYIKGLVTAKNDNTKRCVLDKNNKCTGRYEYFVGPTLETAMVGTSSSNLYQLYDPINNGSDINKNMADKGYAVGVSYWWLPSIISCQDTCSGKSGDDLLKCAENFCDNAIGYDERANSQKLKASCITGLCNYSYKPISCSNSNPYLNQNTVIKTEPDKTICNKLSTDSSPSEDNKKITTSCISDTTSIFDAKTYINIACKEISSFGFTDLSNKKIIRGEGIDYHADLYGTKECTVFFDLNTWKFAYASYHSKDIININGQNKSARELLLNILNYYNMSYELSSNNPIGIDMSGTGTDITWKDLNYNINKVKVTSKVNEIVNNIKVTSPEYNLVPSSSDENSKLNIVSNEFTMSFANLTGQKLFLNKYLNSSNANVSYTFDKYCVSLDGKAAVYKAPSNGICYTSNGEDVLGRNVYYTDLNATPNKNFSSSIKNNNLNHEFNTTKVSIENDNGINYFENEEYCPYIIEDTSSNELECIIEVTPKEGTIMHGNDIYVNGGVNVNLKTREQLGVNDNIESYGLIRGNTATVNGIKTLSVDISDKKNGIESIEITGIVESKKGKTAICKKKISIINPDEDCGVSCSINKYNDSGVYEIKSTGKNAPKQYLTALSTNMNFVVTLPSVQNGKRLVRVDNLSYGTIVYGKVEGTTTTGAKCYNLCWTNEFPCEEGTCGIDDIPNCSKLYSPAETGDIKKYCDSNWSKDINNYTSSNDCINRCSNARVCTENRRDIKEVTDSCNNNYVEWGFSKASNCVNYCYYCPECSSDYIYRPINNYNPFPYSSDSNTLGYNYPTGNRIIPSNWVGKTEYIKQDDKDLTSVTGANANQKVEYVIELTPEAIREIRRDTENYNEQTEGNDAYLDYVYMNGVDTKKRYYSKFINETFRSYFTMINGEEVR